MLEVTPEMSTETQVSDHAPEIAISPESDVSQNQGEVNAVAPQATPPEFQPNFKYSVKGQEKEIDETFRPLIKDADTEKKVKELFEKAEGIDFVKEDRKALKSEYEGFKSQVVPYLQEYHKFTTMRDKGNLGAAFQVAGITDEQVFKYALQKLELDNSPNQANLYKNHTDSSLRELELESQLQHFQTQQQTFQAQQFEGDLTQTLSAHNDLIKQVEQRIGRNGAFKEEVIQLGVYEHGRGNELTVAQAVEAVVSKYKPFITPTISMAQPPSQHQRPATMPNTGSSNVSIVAEMPKNVDDLRKLRDKEMAG